MRKAIDALAADNLVVRRQGKGTFVATHTEEKASLFRFLRIRRNDDVDEYPGSRVLDVRRGKASAEAARLLDLKQGAGTLLDIEFLLQALVLMHAHAHPGLLASGNTAALIAAAAASTDAE